MNRQQLEQGDAEGVYVTPAVQIFVAELLRGHIPQIAVGRTSIVTPAIRTFERRQAEVGKLYKTVTHDHQVLGLDILVEYPLLVCRDQPARGASDHLHRIVRLEP